MFQKVRGKKKKNGGGGGTVHYEIYTICRMTLHIQNMCTVMV
jgi:hypothetical protein